ncbi:hypothetical protein ACWA2C_16875 [Priestia megaterium]|jgi:hypothetical protein
MAKKNNWSNMNFTQIMLQQAGKKLSTPIYCRYCGKDLNQPTKESRFNATGNNTGNYANEWETRNHAHTSCYQQHIYGGRR